MTTKQKGRTAPTIDAFRPYPVDVLPDPMRGFVAAGSESIGCDASYLALPLLTAAGAAIGTTRQLIVKIGKIRYTVGYLVGRIPNHKTPALRISNGGLIYG